MRLLLLGVILFWASFAYTQSKNKLRIDELTTLINKAVADENYESAAELKEEKAIRIEIEEAISEGNFEKAESLKNKLLKKSSTNNQTISKPKETIRKKPENKNEAASSKTKDYLFKRGFYFDGMFSYGTGYYFLIGGTIQLGNKWYFGSNEKFKAGLQANWLRGSIYGGEELNIYIMPLNIGLTTITKFKENTGLEVNFMFGYCANPLNEEIGIAFGPELKYRYRALSVGLDYRSFHDLEYDTRQYMFGLSFGFKL